MNDKRELLEKSLRVSKELELPEFGHWGDWLSDGVDIYDDLNNCDKRSKRGIAAVLRIQAEFAARELGRALRAAGINTVEEYLAQGWQPIETAPKDGTVILVWCPTAYQNKGGIFSVFRYGDEWRCGFTLILDPTHWRPLPPPPASNQPTAEGKE